VNRALAALRERKARDGHYTLRAHEGPRVFEQTNDEVGQALAQLVAQLLPPAGELLIDAYCGAGFFAKRLLGRFERIVGIEWDRYAVAAAQQNASATEQYINGDVELELSRVLAGNTANKISVIVDPPATGLTEPSRRALLDQRIDTLVYVSCNPATLARDLAALQQQFTIESVTPLDMFPQTAEIECVALLKAASAERPPA
jgi:23S rRNA (uracil1939-C5)-methyltransferase